MARRHSAVWVGLHEMTYESRVRQSDATPIAEAWEDTSVGALFKQGSYRYFDHIKCVFILAIYSKDRCDKMCILVFT